jgi:DNA-binding transcriptional regulator LsrR (DeoR family)
MRLTEEQIRATVAAVGGSDKAKKALLAAALAGDNNTLVTLRFWAKRKGIVAA